MSQFAAGGVAHPSPLLQSKNNNVCFEDEWAKSLPIVRNLLLKQDVSKFEWQDLFSTNNRIASWVDAGCERLLVELKGELEQHVREAAKHIHSHSEEEALLKAYIQEWQSYYFLCSFLPLPFNFIERNRVPQGAPAGGRQRMNLQQVRNVMLNCWNRFVFADISTRLLSAAMSLIDRERNGELVSTQLVVGVRESFVDLNVDEDDPLHNYREHFEKNYIAVTEQFYRSRTSEVLEQNGVLGYMSYVDEKLAEEEARAKRYLDPTDNGESQAKLVEKCVQALIIRYQDQLLAEGQNLIKNSQVEQLKTLYRLINRTPSGIPTLLDTLHKHIRSEGLAAMQAHAAEIVTDSEKYVEQLLGQYSFFSQLVREAFCNDSRFLTVRDQAFQEVVNNTDVFRLDLEQSGSGGKNGKPGAKPVLNTESKCPELLANYCDLLLRKSALTKKFSSEEIDERLNNVLLVLKYVSAKDVFMRYHKTHLSRRLILELVADQEKEETLVNKFREAGMPVDFVNKLFRMLQDIEVNKDLNAALKRSLAKSASGTCRAMADCVSIKILNAGAWSRHREKAHLSLPRELEEFIPEAEEFYKRQHCGRKLNWAHHWSTGTLTFGNRAGRFELEVTTQQMAVLFCWNERGQEERLNFEAIRLATELSEQELGRTLLSLVAFPKIRSQVLLCDVLEQQQQQQAMSWKSFSNGSQFWVNQDFCLVKNEKPQARGRLNLIGRLQLNQEPGVEQEHEEILQLRTFRVQEAVVKIMKTRKRMSQPQLQTELIDVLKYMFLPSKKLIKEQIEWLIDQKFIKRDSADMNVFVYIT